MFAPTSQIVTGPSKVGKTTAMPGRLTPERFLILIWKAATQAPVLPAEITESAWLSFAILAITAIELLRFFRRLSTGGSSMPMTWGASTTLMVPSRDFKGGNRGSITFCCPTIISSSFSPSSPIDSSAPAIISSGALSPPIASIAIRILSCFLLFRASGLSRG